MSRDFSIESKIDKEKEYDKRTFTNKRGKEI